MNPLMNAIIRGRSLTLDLFRLLGEGGRCGGSGTAHDRADCFCFSLPLASGVDNSSSLTAVIFCFLPPHVDFRVAHTNAHTHARTCLVYLALREAIRFLLDRYRGLPIFKHEPQIPTAGTTLTAVFK